MACAAMLPFRQKRANGLSNKNLLTLFNDPCALQLYNKRIKNTQFYSSNSYNRTICSRMAGVLGYVPALLFLQFPYVWRIPSGRRFEVFRS